MAPHASHISLRNVTMETLPHLIELHSRVFPVSYGHRFYDEVLMAVYYDDHYAGAICCRLEYSKYTNYTAKIYMMTLGILHPYRRLGLASQLIEHIIEYARACSDPIITCLYLHVQTVNEEAIRFYIRHGFRIQHVVQDYYKLAENRDAFILIRPVFSYATQQ
ncbi:putative N-acetyltransferase san [Choanephora cucurbitarum]|uniref:Putative N-acetyltransferase san n=1 Tax=Choanephora cucurbitarum TaxID=101091 RepID=A0A1C7NCN2_9FUNG|nr:putative N-acetyltransferase san [Choanephora cucurbitarum]